MAGWQPPLEESRAPVSLAEQLYGPYAGEEMTDGQRLRSVVFALDVINGRVNTLLRRNNWLTGLVVLLIIEVATAVALLR